MHTASGICEAGPGVYMALDDGMDAVNGGEASFRRNRSQEAVGALSGDPNAGILVELDCGINITNEFGRRCISSAGSAGWNARGPPASTRRTTIRSPACALLNTFAGNNGSDARTAEAIAGARGSRWRAGLRGSLSR